MNKLIPLFTFTFFLHLSTSAAVPQKWTVNVDSSIPEPFQIHAYHGETIDMEATLKSYGQPMTQAATARFLWQTNGMGNAWWQTNATCSAGVVRARFTPAMDPGANAVTFFLEVTDSDGAAFRPNGKIILSRSPGANPETADLPPPGGTIDFSRITYLNAPWCTLEAAEAAVESGVQRSLNAVENLSNAVDQTYAKLSDIPDVPSIAGLATTGEVAAAAASVLIAAEQSAASTYQPLAGMADYAKLSDLPTDYLTDTNLVGYATKGYADDAANSAQSAAEASAASTYQPLAGMADYAKLSDIPDVPSIDGLATTGEVAAAAASVLIAAEQSAASTYQPLVGMSDYAKLSDIPEVPSLDGYATKSYVEYAVTAAVIGTGSEDFAIRLLSPDGSTYQTADGSVYQITIAPAETNWIDVAWPTVPYKYQGNNTWFDDYSTLRWREDDNIWELSDSLYGIFEATPAEGLQATNITLHSIETTVHDKVFARIIVDAHPVTNKINQVIYTDTLAEATNATLAAANAYTDAHSGGVDTNAVKNIVNAAIVNKRDKAGPDALVVYDASFGPWKDTAGNEYALTWIPYNGGYWVRNFDPEYPPPAPGSMWSEESGLSSNETSMVVYLMLEDNTLTNFPVSRAITPVPTDDRLARVSQIPSGADRARWDAKVSYYADSYLIGILAESTALNYKLNPEEGWNLNNQGNFSFRLQGPDSENSYFSFSMYGRSSLLRPDGSDVMTSNKTASAITATISTNNPAFVSAVRSTPPDPETPWGTYGTLGAAIAGIIAALSTKLTKGLDAQGVPTDANVQELFSEDSTSTVQPSGLLSNAVLDKSIVKVASSLVVPETGPDLTKLIATIGGKQIFAPEGGGGGGGSGFFVILSEYTTNGAAAASLTVDGLEFEQKQSFSYIKKGGTIIYEKNQAFEPFAVPIPESGSVELSITANAYILKNGVETPIGPCAVEKGDVFVLHAELCLASNTPILMSDGTTRRICDIRVGDSVMSVNPETGALEADRVVACDGDTDKRHNVKDVWRFDDGSVIETVHRHRVYNVDLGEPMYMEAWNIGERCFREDGSTPRLVSHERVNGDWRHCTIFTEKWNNYFANGILCGNRKSAKLTIGD